ncbi:MAG: hypothetical protein RIK87_08250 [Fuerstiella sp.]
MSKNKTRTPSVAAESPNGSIRQLWNELSKNRFGMIGFGLSLLQLVVHAAWIIFATLLAGSGQAEQLQSDDWQMWVMAILIILGAVLTAISLFLCLYGAIHGRPRVLALIGLCLSFFVGALTTFVLILNALSA